MITVYDVVKWLESDFDFEANSYVSPLLSMKEEKVLCCQSGQSQSINPHPGVFDVLPVDLYIHWTTDADETEKKANEIYKKLYRKTNFIINNEKICFLNMSLTHPKDMGKDGAGIYNRMISFDLTIDTLKPKQ